jgi:hypothetical protein
LDCAQKSFNFSIFFIFFFRNVLRLSVRTSAGCCWRLALNTQLGSSSSTSTWVEVQEDDIQMEKKEKRKENTKVGQEHT